MYMLGNHGLSTVVLMWIVFLLKTFLLLETYSQNDDLVTKNFNQTGTRSREDICLCNSSRYDTIRASKTLKTQ